MSVCRVCHERPVTAMGACWRCIEAESIISEGLDMFDKGLSNNNLPAETAMDKVRLLVVRGCMRKY